jgi:hypothetical protein
MFGEQENEKNLEEIGCIDWKFYLFLEGLCNFTKLCDLTL